MGQAKIPWPPIMREAELRQFELKWHKIRALVKAGGRELYHERRNQKGFLILKWR